ALVGAALPAHIMSVDNAVFPAPFRPAMVAAADDWLVTIGLEPTRPETGYGYIERSTDVIAECEDGTVYRSVRFVEKPPLDVATQYVSSGHFLWNASMFIWKCS